MAVLRPKHAFKPDASRVPTRSNLTSVPLVVFGPFLPFAFTRPTRKRSLSKKTFAASDKGPEASLESSPDLAVVRFPPAASSAIAISRLGFALQSTQWLVAGNGFTVNRANEELGFERTRD
jgi:hypothetical protein